MNKTNCGNDNVKLPQDEVSARCRRTSGLTFVEFKRRGHSTFAVFKDQAGRLFPMFLVDLEAALLEQRISIAGCFKECKRGTQGGIKLCEPEELEEMIKP